jgi:O-acetyl-ADP-ribose deacetylase (regulator of RNase III)
MGKGLALQFKERFPVNFRKYKEACDRKYIAPCRVFPVKDGDRWIVNFPTKNHWRHPSKIEYIEGGLRSLKQFIIEREIKSIAIPALGCGLGGLSWSDVKPLITSEFEDLPEVSIEVYEPREE